jgi:hypothetical protein
MDLLSDRSIKESHKQSQFNSIEWGILLKVLPLSGLFIVAKLVAHYFSWEIWAFDALTAALFSAATFTIALVLSGTLADYRACETMPLQIATALETIQDTNETLSVAHPDYCAEPIRAVLFDIGVSILDWLQTEGDFHKIEMQIDRLNPLLAPTIAITGGSVLVNRIQTEQSKIRAIAWQMKVNRDTDFLKPAYILLWLFLWGSTIALLLINAAEFSESAIVSTFIFTAFFYLLFLIRDLDDPFEYDGKSSVDVDLSILDWTCNRLNRCKTEN